MSTTPSASSCVFASAAVRASGAVRPRVAVPARQVTVHAKSAKLGPIRLPTRGAKLTVRAGDGSGLDRDAPENQEKFAIIGYVKGSWLGVHRTTTNSRHRRGLYVPQKDCETIKV